MRGPVVLRKPVEIAVEPDRPLIGHRCRLQLDDRAAKDAAPYRRGSPAGRERELNPGTGREATHALDERSASGDVDQLHVVAGPHTRAPDPMLLDRPPPPRAAPVDYNGFHVALRRSNRRILVFPVSPRMRTTNWVFLGPRT